MASNPFADLIPSQQAQQPRAPGYIAGRPKPVAPIELAREERAIEDQSMQRQQFQATLSRQDAAAEREARRDQRQAVKDAEGTENERTAAFLATRLAGSWNDVQRLTRENPDAASPELDAELLGGVFGRRNLNSSARQRVEDAQLDVLDAALTLGTGAAYTKEQLEGYRQSYFPQYWDDEAAVADKKARLDRVLQAARVKAGRAAPMIDQALGLGANTSGDRGELVFNDQLPEQVANAVELSEAQKAALSALAQNNGSDAELQALARGFGVQVTPESLGQLRKFYADPSNRATPTSVTVDNTVRPIDPQDGVSGAFMRGVGDGAMLGFSDEIGGLVDTVKDGGTYADNVNRRRSFAVFDESEQGSPGRLAGQLLGGAVLPSFGARSVGQLARLGAGYGGVYGFGSADGSVGERLGGAALGAGTGAAAGGALGYLGNVGAARFGGRTPPGGGGVNREVVDAAERQGVELVRPDVEASRRSVYGFLESLPVAGGRVRQDLQRGADQIEARVADIGGGLGAPRQTTGNTIRAGAERYVDRSRGVVNRLYDRAGQLAGNTQVTPTEALRVIDENIAQLGSTPNANRTKLDVLNQLRGDLVDDAGNVRPLSVQALRDLRTAARDELATKGLRFSDTERRITQAIDAAGTDIRRQLSGPALRAYDRADRSYRERVDLVDNVVERFIGNNRGMDRSGEAIMASVENAAQPRSGDAAALNRLMERLEPAERTQVASTIASQLGRRGVDGDNAFSPNLFFSQVQKYSPEARRAIFGQQGADDLADLARIAEARTGTMGRLNNSRSGQVSNWFSALTSVFSGGGVGAGVGAVTGLGAGAGAGAGAVAAPAILGGAMLTARALGNRRVVATLAQAARANTPTMQQRVLNRLGDIAAREPTIANDILPIREALSASISRAAANDQEQDRR